MVVSLRVRGKRVGEGARLGAHVCPEGRGVGPEHARAGRMARRGVGAASGGTVLGGGR